MTGFRIFENPPDLVLNLVALPPGVVLELFDEEVEDVVVTVVVEAAVGVFEDDDDDLMRKPLSEWSISGCKFFS